MLIKDFLTPVNKDLVDLTETMSAETLGNHIVKYEQDLAFPDLDQCALAIFDVREGRNAIGNESCGIGGDTVRKELYKLYIGNWNVSIVDLGSVKPGANVTDTYYAVQEIVAFLIKKNIVPIIIGGGQDLVYANYKAYYQLEQVVNLVVASPKFNIGSSEEVTSQSYLSNIILEKPSILFNYANLGYQTYYNSQNEIDLIEKMGFETYRVGALKDITIVEPVMRDADIVAIDLSVVRHADAQANQNAIPNGLYGDQICAIARYAGISDKVSSFGIYEFNELLDTKNLTSQLIAQMIWYFIEGYSYRSKDYPFCSKEEYVKYMVVHESNEINFYKSPKSGRWWIQVDLPSASKYNKHMLIPCTHDDYLNALEEKMPERWFKAQIKIG